MSNLTKVIRIQIDEIEQLRSALKPFAEIGSRYPDAESDDKEIYHTNLGRLTLGDFRAAWVAMTPKPRTKGG